MGTQGFAQLGGAMRDHRGRAGLAACLAVGAVAAQWFGLIRFPHRRWAWYELEPQPWGMYSAHGLVIVALCGFVAVACWWAGARGRYAFGLRFGPLPGWRYWGRIAVLAGVAIGLLLAVTMGGMWLLGFEPDIPVHTELTPENLVAMLLWAPLFEELLYRFALCMSLAAWLGDRWAIAISGSLFALYHWPEIGLNVAVAGFLFGWVFLRSGSLVLPMALHAVGNLCVVVGNELAYRWLGPG